jgi:type 1 fimbriae regulatory protein FimB/type 1 fimbriae regulatory protein FimE
VTGLTAKRRRAPTIVNGTLPPPRRKNEELRPREFLTGEEVERLRKAAGDRLGRYPHRDSTMILLAYRHGLRVTELVGLRWDMVDLTQGQLHVRRLKQGRPSTHILRGSEIRACVACARAGAALALPVHHRARLADDRGRLRKRLARIGQAAEFPFPVTRTCCAMPAALSSPTTGTTRAPSGVAWAPQHPAHDAVHRTHHQKVQRFLAR